MRLFVAVLCLAIGLSNARWVQEGRSDQSRDTSFIGEATNELSTAILQGYIDENENLAFSPLGYSAILAFLAEGAKGETREQLYSALRFPDDAMKIRKAYRDLMERLKFDYNYAYNQPELTQYFLVFKNYTVNDDYRKVLKEYYLTDIRFVETAKPQAENNSFVDDDDDDYDDDDDDDIIPVTDKMEEKTSEESEQKSSEATEKKPSEVLEKKTSEATEEKPADATEDCKTESDEKLISFAIVDTPEKVDVTQVEYKPAKNIKEKIKLVKNYPKKDDFTDEEETMLAVEARNHHARSLKISRKYEYVQVTTGQIPNTVGTKSTITSPSSVMIIFNSLYFRGSWKTPFDVVEPGLFYKSSSEKKNVTMLKTIGTFKTAFIPGLDSQAISLPYDGGRYSLLMVVPRTRDGLSRLIADLPSTNLEDINDSLKEEELQLTIPTFSIQASTKPILSLLKFGVSKIFTPEADLSGISPDQGLFVEEMAQYVLVRVDNGETSTTFINNAYVNVPKLEQLPPTPKPITKFSVEHPFIFYVLDSLDNLVLIAGKVVNPVKPFLF